MLLTSPTARRYLQTLTHLGYVLHDEESKRYQLTPKVFRLCGLVIEDMDLRTKLHSYLKSIVRELNITSTCTVLEGGEAITAELIHFTDDSNLALTAGLRLHSHATSLGKAIVAFLPPKELHSSIGKIEILPFTPLTMTNPSHFLEKLEGIDRSTTC